MINKCRFWGSDLGAGLWDWNTGGNSFSGGNDFVQHVIPAPGSICMLTLLHRRSYRFIS